MAAGPLVFLPLSIGILSSGVLPRIFGYTGLAIGALFSILGGLVLFHPWQYLVDYLAYAQGGWWLSAATAMLLRAQPIADLSSRQTG